MPSPPFYLQIIGSDGVVIRTYAGGKAEADLVKLIVQNVMSRGVGFLKTSSHVEQALRDGIGAAIQSIKIQDPYAVVSLIDE